MNDTAAAHAASFAIGELVDRFGGRFDGDAHRRVTGFATLSKADPEELAFVASARYRDEVAASQAAAVLATDRDADALGEAHAARLWICSDPYLQFARIAQFFESARAVRAPAAIDATASVQPSASIAPDVSVAPFAVIGADVVIGEATRIGAGSVLGDRVRIGSGVLVHPGVVVYAGCTIGDRCVLHSGVVIGADGFGFAKDGASWVKIPQVGGVVVGDDVEIGANTTIDRGTLDDTRIGHGVKLDNQIQIAHNVDVGEHTIMAACVGVAGSAIIGKRCMIGGAARIMGHVTIADDTVISTQTFVSRSITKPAQYTGYYPMAEHGAFEKSAAVLRRLDRLRDRVRRLERTGRDSSKPESTE